MLRHDDGQAHDIQQGLTETMMTYELKLNGQAHSKPLLASDLNISEMGVVTDSSLKRYHGHILLRHYDGIVSLTSPGSTWDLKCALEIRRLVAGESVTLTVKE